MSFKRNDTTCSRRNFDFSNQSVTKRRRDRSAKLKKKRIDQFHIKKSTKKIFLHKVKFRLKPILM